MGGVGSGVSGAGRGRGAGRLDGSDGVAGSGASGGSSSVGVSTAGGSVGCGMGAVTSGGGVLTEGGAARTICLLPQPEAARAVAKRSTKSWRLGILCIRHCCRTRFTLSELRSLHLMSQWQLDSKRCSASHFRLKVYRTIQQLHSSKGAGESDSASSRPGRKE